MKIGFTVLGRPVSVNHAYPQSRLGRRFLSREGKDWKKMIGWAAMMARREVEVTDELFNGRWWVDLKFFWNDNRRRDAENCVKIALDAMEGIFYADDKKVSGSWDYGIGEPRVEIILRPYETKN